MPSDSTVFDAVLSGRGTINFRDLEHLLVTLGFRLERIRGSHHIYFHPVVGRPFPVQPDGRDAKQYQVRQLRDIIRRHGLTLDRNG